ncbi:uncharacterized protein RSE6_09214 [Rhynchosporium secalis]|uniref:2EXR domain-containing protein n=1 Tax=Rhynchosporium secalis TaxID=38038 RepID=A0A1E1MHD1_RHYSE|nr:uncharacterized protein RSE6_09214 [Rhynchosporium secalis]
MSAAYPHALKEPNMDVDSNLFPSSMSALDISKKDQAAKMAIPIWGEKKMTSRIKALLSALPLLVMEKMPVPTCARLEVFELFDKLPPEIRSMIYELMSSESRCVKLFEDSRRRRARMHAWNSNVQGQSRHPAIVHVSREARWEALRSYTICHDRPRIYIDKALITESGLVLSTQSMKLDNAGVKNTYFIDFAKDYFSHGQTKFRVSKLRLAGPGDFSFEAGILARIQNVHQQQCFGRALRGFDDIWTSTTETTAMFRHRIWENLRHVTIVIEEYSAFDRQETFCWTMKRRRIEQAFTYLVKANQIALWRQLSNADTRELDDMGPVQFQLHFKWQMKQVVDETPCAPKLARSTNIDPGYYRQLLDEDQKTLIRCAELYRARGD